MKKLKVQVGGSWRIDVTYIKVKRQRCYLYRAGNTVDSRLIDIDKSGSNSSAIRVYNKLF